MRVAIANKRIPKLYGIANSGVQNFRSRESAVAKFTEKNKMHGAAERNQARICGQSRGHIRP